MSQVKLYNGDCLEVLKKAPDNSIDSIVTDPPYGLSFMGKRWDYDVPSVDVWRECLRVLKPGGHLLAFGGTRTYHRLVVAIEDAGFEIRDQIQWIYGQGFPKSMDISKAIDAQVQYGSSHSTAIRKALDGREVTGTKLGMPGKSLGQKPVQAFGLRDEGNGKTSDGKDIALHKARLGESIVNGGHRRDLNITAPATPEAQKWSGWGTALKPANEPICLARKPLSESTIAKNVLKHGTGGLNIDGTRIETEEKLTSGRHTTGDQEGPSGYATVNRTEYQQNAAGRFPSNVILDEDAAKVLDGQSGLNCGASRFFYVAKASKSDRGEGNTHPTVKPIKLMEYLIKLVTPEGGKVLDPFMGSGTTGVAALRNGFQFRGIEMSTEYYEIATKRIQGETNGL